MNRESGQSDGKMFHINPDNHISVFVQIENQIQFAIASGRIKPGEQLPSVRDMSDMLNVNPNTVAKAYRDLELIGLVHARRGVGYTVVEKQVKACCDRIQAVALEHLREATAECVAAGLSPTLIRETVRESIKADELPY